MGYSEPYVERAQSNIFCGAYFFFCKFIKQRITQKCDSRLNGSCQTTCALSYWNIIMNFISVLGFLNVFKNFSYLADQVINNSTHFRRACFFSIVSVGFLKGHE